MNKPFFSIITVCFNSVKTIRRTLESVLEQDFKDYEFILVDGASTDGTVEMIREYEPEFGGRMRWVSEPDHGIYDAMNKGIRMSGGSFLSFMNSDDYFEPHALRESAEFIQKHPGSNIYYGMIRIMLPEDPAKEESISRVSHYNLHNYSLDHQGTFTSRELIQKAGGFDQSYTIAADYDFWLRVLHDGTGKFQPMDVIVAVFRQGGISHSPKTTLRTGVEYWLALYRNGVISKSRYLRSVYYEYRSVFKRCLANRIRHLFSRKQQS